jgi:peptide/nickel transport system ATP-binding protein
MGVVAEMADRVIILQNGAQVETAATRTLFAQPQQPYTQALLAAVPRMGSPARPEPQGDTIARLTDVSVRFPMRGGLLNRHSHNVHAVEDVSLSIRKGETFALVGESGCGKSTIAKAIVGLVPYEGRIEVAGLALSDLDTAGKKALRRQVQMVFQDPMAALDPRMRVADLVSEPLMIHNIGDTASRRATAADLFNRVGLQPDQLDRYPHEFSGGQRQRICIARALALNPQLVIADESVSALDVSVQARVLDLLRALQKEFGVAYLFISHDMAVVENISDRVAVMYLGQIVETGTRAQVFTNPRHAYTQRLIEAVPVPDPTHIRPLTARLAGEVPSPVYPLGRAPAKLTLTDLGEGHLVAKA